MNHDEVSRPLRGTRDGVLLERSVCVTPAPGNRSITVADLRRMIWHLPDESVVLIDGQDVVFATPYGGVLYMDTGARLAPPCPACGHWGCDCDQG